jgi:hypothetical protein
MALLVSNLFWLGLLNRSSGLNWTSKKQACKLKRRGFSEECRLQGLIDAHFRGLHPQEVIERKVAIKKLHGFLMSEKITKTATDRLRKPRSRD